MCDVVENLHQSVKSLMAYGLLVEAKYALDAIAEIEAHRAQNVGGDDGEVESLRRSPESVDRTWRIGVHSDQAARVRAALAAWREALRTATVDEEQADTEWGAMSDALIAADALLWGFNRPPVSSE